MWKRIILSTIGVIAIAIFVAMLFRPGLIASHIEDWDLYQETNRNVSLGSCDNKDYQAGEELINKGSKSELEAHFGLSVLQTKNPLHWTNEQFRWFKGAKCAVGTLIPLRAYPDKLLWRNECSWFSNLAGCTATEKALVRWEEDHAQSSGEFNEAGIRFTIPPHINHSLTSGAYENFYRFGFGTEGPMVADTSGISLFIPLGDTDFPSNDDSIASIPEQTERKMINWGNLQGNRYVYDKTTEWYGMVWSGTITTEIYPVSSSNQPIVLSYSHSIHDDTVETLWMIIHNDVEMDLESNLPSYQKQIEIHCNTMLENPCTK